MGTKHSEEEQMEANPSGAPGLKRSLSVWAAVGLSVVRRGASVLLSVEGTTVALILVVTAFHATAFDSFLWSGTIGTLILLVVYVLATVGCVMLVFVRRKLPVPMWQVIVPIAALVVLGYTLYRNVIPYPTGAGRWFPIVGGAWLLAAVVAVIAAPGTARKLGAALAAREGIAAPGAEDTTGRHRLTAARDEAS